VNNQDQVIKILERYPELDVSKDFSFTTSINTTNYLSNIASKIKLKDSLKKRFSKSNPEIVSFLEQILELNPFLRPTAKQLLSNPIFN
jgi:serine/threonine protein kinase